MEHLSQKPLRQASVEIEVPFHDVDPMNIVWHGHYYKYFEIARCALLKTFDYDYPQMHASNYAWPIVETFCRYAKPILYGMIIRVEASLMEYEHRLKIDYIITDSKAAKKLCRGYTVQVAVKMPGFELCYHSPDILLQKLGIQK